MKYFLWFSGFILSVFFKAVLLDIVQFYSLLRRKCVI